MVRNQATKLALLSIALPLQKDTGAIGRMLHFREYFVSQLTFPISAFQ